MNMKIEWGPWVEMKEAWPNVGDYVQINGICKTRDTPVTKEGFVIAHSKCGIILDSPLAGTWHSFWRRAAPPEEQKRESERERETVDG